MTIRTRRKRFKISTGRYGTSSDWLYVYVGGKKVESHTIRGMVAEVFPNWKSYDVMNGKIMIRFTRGGRKVFTPRQLYLLYKKSRSTTKAVEKSYAPVKINQMDKRRFSGKVYYGLRESFSKKEALELANTLRKKGFLARVVKSSNGFTYNVYVRKRR